MLIFTAWCRILYTTVGSLLLTPCPPRISLYMWFCFHVLLVCLFMDAQSVETRVQEGGTTAQHSARVGGRQATWVQLFLLMLHVCQRMAGFLPSVFSVSTFADRCKKLDYLVKTSHEPSPTARRAGSNNPKETGSMCALEVANKTCQHMI